MRLSILLLFSSWVPSSLCRRTTAAESQDDGRNIIVFRADSRTPAEMRAAGGFQPRGFMINNYLHLAPDISLYNHVRGAGLGSSIYSGYVSTTEDFSIALNFLRARSPNPGFIYSIHVSPNFIDASATLGDFYEHPHERELAALGGIRCQQITGWQSVDTTERENLQVSHFIPNPDYRPAIFDRATSGGAQPQLAGFPPDHQVFREGIQPWCGFPGKKRAASRCPLAQQNATRVAQNYMASSVLRVTGIKIHSRVSGSSLVGTTDSLLIIVGPSKPVVLFRDPYPGRYQTLNLDLMRAFEGQEIYLSSLTGVALIVAPFPHPIMADAFRIESLVLQVNTTLGVFSTNKFGNFNREFGAKGSELEKVWAGEIGLDDWESVVDEVDE